MTTIDKFYSDADKLVSRSLAPGGATGDKFAAELTRLFLPWARDYGDIGTDLSSWWADKYRNTLDTEQGKKAAVAWFGSLLSLLSGEFEKDMDFPDEDWEEIRDTVSACAEDLDIELIQSILMIVVERGHA